MGVGVFDPRSEVEVTEIKVFSSFVNSECGTGVEISFVFRGKDAS
jgi:hypothetical protein